MFKFRKGDFDAYLGVLFDGIPKIITGVVVLTPLIGADVMFEKLLPAIALGVMISSVFFYLFGEMQKKASGNPDTVALPGGINAGRFFVFLFAIMMPTWFATEDATLTIAIGIGAHIISAIISIALAFGGDYLSKAIPSEALFGGLAGGALTWLALATFNDMLATPLIAFASMFIVLGVYLAKVKLPVSPAVLSIVVGIIIGSFTGVITLTAVKESFTHFGFYVPGSMVFEGGYFSSILKGIIEAVKYLPIIFVFSLGETISNLQSLEQAKSVGDEYPVTKSLVGVNVVSLITALFGNPFPIGIWWGYPSWKDRKASTTYPILVGLTYLILGATGVIAVVTAVVPVATVLPILVFIGLVSLQNAFANADSKYYGIMALAAVIPIVEWGKDLGENLGFFVNGAMIISIIWGSAFMFIAKNEWNKVAITFVIGAACAFLGLLHVPDFIISFNFDAAGSISGLNINITWKYVIMYVVAAVLSYIAYKTKVVKYEE